MRPCGAEDAPNLRQKSVPFGALRTKAQDRRSSSMEARPLFEALVRENAEMLQLYLRSALRHPDLEDEIFQEALIVAWRRIGDYDTERPFGAWLRGIAGRLMLAHRRARGRAAVSLEPELLEALEGECSEFQRQRGDTLDEKLEALQNCVEQLPPASRKAIDLRYSDGLRGQDLAQTLGSSFEAVKKTLQRTRARLLDCVERKLGMEVAR